MTHRVVLCCALLAAACEPGTTSCEPGQICTWFGTPGISGLAEEGTHRLDASTFWVTDLAFHPTEGWPVIMDWNNHRVVTVDDEDQVVVITGVGGELGDGPEGDPLKAQWNHPTDAAFQSDGTLILAAWHNSRLAAISPDRSSVTFIAGTGGRDFSGDGAAARDAVLDLPCGVRVGADGTIYLSDMANQRIRRIAADGTIDTVAGVGAHGFNGDGPAMEVMFASPALQRAEPAFKMDLHDGALFIADTHNGRIRKFDLATGMVTTVAGSGKTPPDSENGVGCTEGCGYGGDGGPATEAMLNTPTDVAVAADGTIYIADTDNSCIRRVSPDGIIDTYAGRCGEQGYDGDHGPPTEALLARPFGVALDNDGVLYIADTYNSVVRQVLPE